MSIELSISSSQGRPAEWHASVQADGTRLTACPTNADIALASRNEHWIGDLTKSDADKFNELFAPTIAKFNTKQKRDDRKMGPESSKTERQKSYYEGIEDGTFCHGTGKMQEKAIYEAVLQIGNKDDNGVTDAGFDMKHWYALKQSGREEEASAYALAHLNDSENVERTKRILRRATDRIAAMDPEHLIVLRADLNGDEPCGTLHVHLAYTLRATGYKFGMEERVGSVKALAQMGFVKMKDTEYGIVQLHEKFKDIIEEEMIADAKEYGYEPIKRKAPSGEKRKRSDVDVFRQMAAEQSELEAHKAALIDREENVSYREADADFREFDVGQREAAADEKEKDIRQREAIQKDREEFVESRIKYGNQLIEGAAKREKAIDEKEKQQLEKDAVQAAENRWLEHIYRIAVRLLNQMGDDRTDFATWDEFGAAFKAAARDYKAKTDAQARADAQADIAKEKALYASARQIYEQRIAALPEIPDDFKAWAERKKIPARVVTGADGKKTVEFKTIADMWRDHIAMRRKGTWTPEQAEIIRQADKGLGE